MERYRFSENSDLFEILANEHQRLVVVVFGEEHKFFAFGVVINSLERCFVIDYHSGDVSV